MSLGQFNVTITFQDTPTRVVYSHTKVDWYLTTHDKWVYGPHDIHKKEYLLLQYNMPLCDWKGGEKPDIVITE